MSFTQSTPEGLTCEAVNPIQGTLLKLACKSKATHIYGPECERLTGELMYLCTAHAVGIQMWKDSHANDPVECKTHGRIGKVKDYLILTKIP